MTPEEIELFQKNGPSKILTDDVDLVEVWNKYEAEDNKAICGAGTSTYDETVRMNSILYRNCGVEAYIDFTYTGRVIDIGAGYDILRGFCPTSEYYPVDIKPRTPSTIVVKNEKLPFRDNFTWYVFSLNMFQHINVERRLRYVQEAYRILKPGGRFFIGASIHNPFSLMNPVNYDGVEYAKTGEYFVPFINNQEIATWIDVGFYPIFMKFSFVPGLSVIYLGKFNEST